MQLAKTCVEIRPKNGEKLMNKEIRAGVGRSEKEDSYEAGKEAALEAGIESPGLALVFCTGRHDPEKFRDGIRSVVGPDCRIVGGYTVGIITRDAASYDGYEAGVALIGGDNLKVDAFAEVGIQGGESRLGEALGSRLSAAGAVSDTNLLLFYDTVFHENGKPRINMATPLLEGMARALPTWPNLAGMGMIGDMQLQPTWQFLDDSLLQQSAIALLLGGGITMDTTVMHGCRPAGRYHEVTKAEGPVVLEIDGRPALQVIREMLGTDSGLEPEDYAFFVTLGVNHGDKYGDFREDDYANRMCIGVDEERQGLVMFENDLVAGSSVQLMRRSVDFGYIGPRTDELFSRAAAAGRTPVLAFYIDCAGRAGAYCGLDAEEADEVRRAIPPGVPLLGVYSGVEIATMRGVPQALDWTGVLCLLSV